MGTKPLFAVAEESEFGVRRALDWQAARHTDLRRWVADRDLRPCVSLTAMHQRAQLGLDVFTDTDVDPELPKSIVDLLTEDCAAHPHGSSMIADRATVRLVGNGSLLAPLYVDETRELFLPSWLTVDAVTSLFPPAGSFWAARRTCATWLLLDAPVYRPPDRAFATFAYFFTRDGTDPGARWHWRANEGRD